MACINTIDGRHAHKQLMQEFLTYLNANSSDFVLKGGTALMLCYSLGRFSEDLDFDGTRGKRIERFVTKFCQSKGISCCLAEDTQTVERFIVHYPVGDEEATLKIEVSYRAVQSDITTVGGIKTYTINQLLRLKCTAFMAREKVRDLYDILHIYDDYKLLLKDTDLSILRESLSNKDAEVVLDILDIQKDPLIDNDKLGVLYIDVCERLDIQV